jgi:hypothetical protein
LLSCTQSGTVAAASAASAAAAFVVPRHLFIRGTRATCACFTCCVCILSIPHS